VSEDDKKVLNIRVKGEDPFEAAAAVYSNFLAVSRVGTDVQLEFIFLDLNLLAVALEKLKQTANPEVPELKGKTVAKIVMPGATLLQLRQHFENIFNLLESEVSPKRAERAQEVKNDRRTKIG